MSLDAATTQLYEKICGVPQNAAFLKAAHGAPATLAADLIGIVPGAFYREHHDTGADGERILDIARQLGCEAERIPVASFGTLDENAAIIADWLATNRGKRIALVSLSKGGADVRRALSTTPAAFENVAAWISISGIVNGTPLIAWLRARPLRWWAVRLLLWCRGHSGKALTDLQHTTAEWPALPPHMRIVHVIGFPQESDLAHRWSPRAYKRLAPLGPNDGGGILLADCEKLPGIVCPIAGADHYLTPPWDVLPLITGIIAGALADCQNVGPLPILSPPTQQ